MDAENREKQAREKKLSEEFAEFIDLNDEDLEEVDVLEFGGAGGQCGCRCRCRCGGCRCRCRCGFCGGCGFFGGCGCGGCGGCGFFGGCGCGGCGGCGGCCF